MLHAFAAVGLWGVGTQVVLIQAAPRHRLTRHTLPVITGMAMLATSVVALFS